MKRFLQVVVACILLAPLVFGETYSFTWVAPTKYTDGSPLANTDIKEYHLHCNSGLEVTISNSPRVDGWVSANTDFPPGSYQCWVHAETVDAIHSHDSNHEGLIIPFEVAPSAGSGSGCS